MIKSHAIIGLVIFLTIRALPVEHPIFTQDNSSKEYPKDWVLLNQFDFPVWLVADVPPKDQGLKIREIFLFLETRSFSQENIKTILIQLTSKYKSLSSSLTITIYDSKEMIQRAVKSSKYTISVDFVDTPEGKEAERQFYEKYYPLKSGYFRANYIQTMDGRESVLFSPAPEKEEMISIQLRN